jgi:hypothetical protein
MSTTMVKRIGLFGGPILGAALLPSVARSLPIALRIVDLVFVFCCLLP